MYPLAGAILTGGKSTRMGRPKAGIMLADGDSLFGRVYSAMSALRVPIFVVGHSIGIEVGGFRDLRVIDDIQPGRGPMGGLQSLLRSNEASHYLIAACDQPLLTSELLAPLIRTLDDRPCVYVTDGTLHPLPGRYPSSALPDVEQLLKNPSASLKQLIEVLSARTIDLSVDNAVRLTSANYPEDLMTIENFLRRTES